MRWEFRSLRFAVAAAAPVMILTSSGATQPTTWPSKAAYVAELSGGAQGLEKLEPRLLEARGEVARGVRSPAEAIRTHVPYAVRGDGRLQVIISTDDIAATVAACRQAGIEVTNVYDKHGLRCVTVRCASPMELDGIAASPATRRIMAESPAQKRAGSVAGQGDSAMTSDIARTNFGIDGTGFRIGVLSDSIFDIRLGGGTAPGSFPGNVTGSTDQVSGDLPDPLWVVDPGDTFPAGAPNNSDEGNAMAQIVHDIAPGADISFASAFDGYFDFATNITLLHTDATNPADIIVDDVGYFVEPTYQDGPIALAYEDAFVAGVPGFSSAGNNDDDAHESAYADINPGLDNTTFPPTGADFHDFGGGDTHLAISVLSGGVVTVTLHWDEPYGGGFAAGPGSEADLDLYITEDTVVPLVDTNPSPGAVGGPDNVVVRSTAFQGVGGAPSGDAVEVVQVQNTTVSTQTWHVVVEHFDGIDPTNIHLDINIAGGSVVDTALIGARTVTGHPAAANVMATAAVFFCEVDTGGGVFGPTGGIDVESFSALGGNLPFFFDELGQPMATEFRPKPEVTAPDGVNTTFFGSTSPAIGGLCGEPDGFLNFFGTSAASPHAAAGAALLLQRRPDATPQIIYDTLRSTAADIDTAGDLAAGDFRAGDGLIDLNAAASSQVLLLIDLDEFYAETEGPGEPVRIVWRTAAEVDNAGFHVYRAEADGLFYTPGERLTESIVPARGTPGSGASYEFIDPVAHDPEAGRRYYLEDIDVHGKTTLHGPVPIRLAEHLLQIRNWRNYD